VARRDETRRDHGTSVGCTARGHWITGSWQLAAVQLGQTTRSPLLLLDASASASASRFLLPAPRPRPVLRPGRKKTVRASASRRITFGRVEKPWQRGGRRHAAQGARRKGEGGQGQGRGEPIAWYRGEGSRCFIQPNQRRLAMDVEQVGRDAMYDPLISCSLNTIALLQRRPARGYRLGEDAEDFEVGTRSHSRGERATGP
jgi:hypothetical protein